MVLTSAKPKTVLDDSDRMFQQVGTAGILPQLLAALGVIFNAAGVGEVISHGISGVVPEGNRLIGVIAYCLGMVFIYNDHGKWLCGIYCHYCRNRCPIRNRSRGRSRCSRSTGDDCRFLRNIVDTDGSQFQCITRRITRDEKFECSNQNPSTDCRAANCDPYRIDVLLGILVVKRNRKDDQYEMFSHRI